MTRSRTTLSGSNVAQKNSTLLPPAGSTIPESDRVFFENRLGTDFSNVQVHTNAAAASMADSLGAKAFTIGNDIFFGEGRYQPGSTQGRRLLAHELTHVAQQSQPSAATTDAEPRARAASEQVAQGSHVSSEAIGATDHSVHCDDNDDKEKVPRFLPPLTPQLHLDPSLIPPATWLTLQQSFRSRGLTLGGRDADSILQTWTMQSRMLDTFGITDDFKLGPFTKEWILSKGIGKMVEDQQARENPNAMDRFNLEFKQGYPGAFETPIIPIFDLDWFRKKKK